MGRPKEDSPYKHEFCEQLIEHMGRGYSFDSFAAVIGVTQRKLFLWIDKYADFHRAKEAGEVKSLLFWEAAGIGGLTAGKGFNATVWQFSMKNRFRKFGFRDKWAEDDQSLVKIGPTLQISNDQITNLVKMAKGQKEEVERVVTEVKTDLPMEPTSLAIPEE